MLKLPQCIAAGMLLIAATALAQTVPPAESASSSNDVKAEGDRLVLNPFKVTAETSKGYGGTTVSSATRMNVALRDVPQSITIINDQFLRDLNVSSLDMDTAFSYAPGVKFQSWSSGQAQIRGFTSYINFKDGVRLPDNGSQIGSGGATFTPDLVAIDHIEVVKGPASAVVGRGTSGGLINYITKQPQIGVEKGTATATFGTNNYKDFQLDYNMPVSNFSDTMAVRVNMDVLDSGYWRQNSADLRNFAIYPSLLWRPTEKTDLLVQLQYHDSSRPNDFGLAYDTINKRWPDFAYSYSEEYAVRDEESYGVTVNASHAFNRNISVRQVLSYNHLLDDEHMVWPLSINAAAAGNPNGYPAGEIFFTRQLQNSTYDISSFVAQGDLVLQYKVKDLVSTQTLLSYEYTEAEAKARQFNAAMTNITWDFPIYGTPAGNPALVNHSLTKRSLYGLLVSEQLGLFNDRVLLNAGIRRDGIAATKITNLANGAKQTNPSTAINHPRYGIVLKALPSVSVYGVYSKNAQPATTVLHFPNLPFDDARNSILSVNTYGELKEVGVKTSLFKDALNVSASVYKLESFGGVLSTSQGPAQNNPATAGQLESVITPADRTQGFEIEAAGSVFSPKFSILASYQTIDTRRFINGAFREFRGIPEWTASAFLNYDFRSSLRADGFQIHAGCIFQGHQQGDNDNTFTVGSDPHFDAGIVLTRGHCTFALDVQNVTNSVMPTAFSAYRANSVLPPRTIRFSSTYRF